MTYIFAIGLRIVATKNGVSFGGNSTIFDTDQLKGVQRIMKKASKIHRELESNRGLPSEQELDGKLRLRGSKAAGNTYKAWYWGQPQRVTGETIDAAVRELRATQRGTKAV